MDDLFAPAEGDWQRVSPQLATVRRILIGLTATLAVVIGIAIALVWSNQAWIGIVVVIAALAALAYGWVWAGRNQRNWGYAENADDLLVTCGYMFKRLVAIPYGRMQFVDVQAGPLDRAFGIATVTLHTASTETAADIPGLKAAEATRLRNRLTELGESHGAGL